VLGTRGEFLPKAEARLTVSSVHPGKTVGAEKPPTYFTLPNPTPVMMLFPGVVNMPSPNPLSPRGEEYEIAILRKGPPIL
jgi:hypothetical protein